MANRFNRLLLVPIAVVSAAGPGYSIIYMTIDQVQHLMFRGAKLISRPIVLTDEQAKQIKKMTDVNVRQKDLKVWEVVGGGWLIVDEVVGKHEFITYAIALTADGRVKQVEIMDYRESFGYEVRNAEWRKQFVGKTAKDPLKLTVDIQNISGATLSCRHITDGVKRILATYELALREKTSQVAPSRRK